MRRLPSTQAAPANSSAPVIAQPSQSISAMLSDEDADELADGRASRAGSVEVDVLALLGLGQVAARGGEGEERRRARTRAAPTT